MWIWLAVGCFATQDDYLAARERVQDIDGDGDKALQYGGGDCDDYDPERSSLHQESCADEVDVDCSGAVGDNAVDAPTWYLDHDDDGYGLIDVTETSCLKPDGYGGVPGDCDDGDPARNPDAQEVCDAADVDEDCDGLADNEDSDASGASTWFLDEDQDGYGSSETVAACDLPEGYTAADGDCDDGDPAVNPGATEVCRNGVDDDCDGTYNGCGPSGSLGSGDAVLSLQGQSDSAYFGHKVMPGCDLTQDGIEDFVVSAPGRGNEPLQGAIYVFEGGLEGLNGPDDAHASIEDPVVGTELGFDIATCFDFEDDGRLDILVSAPGAENPAGGHGAAYIINGSAVGEWPLAWSSARIVGGGDSGAMSSVDVHGDLTGDGVVDLLVGDGEFTSGGKTVGAAWIVGLIPPGVPGGDLELADAESRIVGSQDASLTGLPANVVGDVNGDGFPEIAVSASRAYGTEDQSGLTYVFEGPVQGDLSVLDADSSVAGEVYEAWMIIAGPADTDIDNDGAADLVFSASQDPDSAAKWAGAVYIFLGSDWADGTTLADAYVRILGEAEHGFLGDFTWAKSDINSDEQADVLVGSNWADTAHVFLGPLEGSLGPDDAVCSISGNGDGSLGATLAAIGDQTRDGYQDFLLGAPLHSWAADYSGAVYLFEGGGL